MFINIDEISKEIICSICLENDDWHFFDCNGNELPVPSEKRIFSSAMKLRYQNKRGDKERGISTVWILVATTEDNGNICVQVGRTKDLKNTLDEIRENVKNDNEFKSLCKVAPKEEFLLEAYYFIRAAYVEGKLGALTYADENMYHKSSLDEYFYEYFKAKR